ncbi:hypothetical protein BH10ACT2_BH10ACT2_27610 [soil metagenome]
MTAVDDFEPAHEKVGGPAFWIAAVVGWAIIIGGIRAGLRDRELKPTALAKWIIGGLVVHDAIWLPILSLLGVGIVWAWRRRIPAFIVWAAMTSAVLTLIAWPFVRGYGRRADVPSALQRNYAHGLLAYIGVTWLLAVGAAIVSRRRAQVPQ